MIQIFRTLLFLFSFVLLFSCSKEKTIYHTLTLKIAGFGTTNPPGGIYRFTNDTIIQLSAYPEKGWHFNNWEGEVSERDSVKTTLYVDKDQTVTAVFNKDRYTTWKMIGKIDGRIPGARGVGWMYDAEWSPDGNYIASCHWDHIYVWSAFNEKFNKSYQLDGPNDWITWVSWSPDQKYIAGSIGGWDSHIFEIWIWEAKPGGKVVAKLKGHTFWINQVKYSPNGKYLASASDDSYIIIWDAGTQQIIHKIHADGVTARTVAWSPDSKRVAAGGYDNIVRIWDAENGTLLKELGGPEKYIRQIAFSPNGKYIGATASDGIVRIWKTESGVIHNIFKGHTTYTLAIRWAEDSRYVASGGGNPDFSTIVWDVEKNSMVSRIEYELGAENINALSWRKGGKYLLETHMDYNYAIIWKNVDY